MSRLPPRERASGLGVCALVLIASACGHRPAPAREAPKASAPPRRPNILIAIADDQSWRHAGAYGDRGVKTPAFDRVARAGVLFNNAFAASPGCSPSRASLLTGRHTWQLAEAGTHASGFPTRYQVLPDLLEREGYFVGHTGKGWGPGDWKVSGRTRNPAGPPWKARTLTPPNGGINTLDYAANFRDFLDDRPAGAPFVFWYGATEPHRIYEKGAGLASGKRLADATVPAFLPDDEVTRSDMLDYYLEIEWFDRHLGAMLELLGERGELDDTIVVVTADNGMPFPRAKANCYEYGIHMPLAMSWPARVRGGRVLDDLVGFVDIAPTLLQAAGVAVPHDMTGRGFLDILTSGKSGFVDRSRTRAYAARERHSSARHDNWTYPSRALRSERHLYIRNFRPDRWPAGSPVPVPGQSQGFYDIDGGPTKTHVVAGWRDPELSRFFRLAVAPRPEEELFDVTTDPANLHNLAHDPAHAAVKAALAAELDAYLRETGDARVLDGGEIWESYPRYSPLRAFPRPPADLRALWAVP